MREDTVAASDVSFPLTWVHTLVIGSGAAGLNAAVQLRVNGIDDILIITEGLQKGTSINTGSDKQTYNKLGLCGADADSPVAMAFPATNMDNSLAIRLTTTQVPGLLPLARIPLGRCALRF
jgi:hypothetical protein